MEEVDNYVVVSFRDGDVGKVSGVGSEVACIGEEVVVGVEDSLESDHSFEGCRCSSVKHCVKRPLVALWRCSTVAGSLLVICLLHHAHLFRHHFFRFDIVPFSL